MKPERHIHPLTGRSWLKLGVEKRSQQTHLSGNNKPCKCHASLHPCIPVSPCPRIHIHIHIHMCGKVLGSSSGESKQRAAPSSERVDFAFMQISRTLQTAQRFFVFIFFLFVAPRSLTLQVLLFGVFFFCRCLAFSTDALLLAGPKLNFAE